MSELDKACIERARRYLADRQARWAGEYAMADFAVQEIAALQAALRDLCDAIDQHDPQSQATLQVLRNGAAYARALIGENNGTK